LKREKDEIIPLGYDRLFKKVFANPETVENLEDLISITLKIPVEDLIGNVKIVSPEQLVQNKNNKKHILDVVAEINFPGEKRNKVNIEVNMEKGSTLIRNIAYALGLYSNGIKAGDNYDNISSLVQISFNAYDVGEKNTRVVKTFMLRDEKNEVLSKALQLYHINIEKAKVLWYDKNIESEEENQDLIKIGALMLINKRADFERCLEEIAMRDKVKKNIKQAVEEFSYDEYEWGLLDEEKDKIARYNAGISYAHKEGLRQGITEGIVQGIQQGIEQGIEQEKIAIAKNLLNQNVSVEIIIQATGLTKEQIEELRN